MAFLLEDYKDVQEIARGGMSKVYLATQISLNRKVIIKEMAAGLLTSVSEVRRFENEARAAAALDHDNIIRIYDFGEDRGSFYISMEFIDGPDLEEIIKDSGYVPEIALMILLQALKGLDFAHQQHIIHRDIKPGNILVSKTGAVKVVDFGLAHASKQQIHLTATDIIVGTPLYMSPEQATGEEKKDIRMDVWSVGVLLYRIITGKYPFSGENVPAILFNIVQTKEPPIETLAPALPDDLAKRINQCLEKERSKRLQCLAPVIESLQNYFYEIGIKDPGGQIRKYITDPGGCSRELSKQLLDFHKKESDARLAAGDIQKAEAHSQEAKKYDPMHRPITRTIEAIKKISSSHISKKRGLSARFSGSALFKRLAVISAIVLVAVTAVLLYLKLPKNNSLPGGRAISPATLTQPPVSQQTAIKPSSGGAADSVKIDSTPAVAKPNSLTDTSPEQKKGAAQRKQNPRNEERASTTTGLLKLAIYPFSAEVTVDGEKLSSREMIEGKRLAAGVHLLVARADGYDVYEKSILIEKNAVQVVSADLIPQVKGMASLHIHSYPWAGIYIDGVFQGNTPTPKPISLSEGKHTLALKRGGYKTHEEVITVGDGELKRMKVQLIQE